MKRWLLILFAYPLSLQAQQHNINIKEKTQTTPPFQFNIPPDLYCQKLGFFCRQEVTLDKKLAVPLRFRLGSMEQCNYLEQKTAYKLPQQ